jgi:hypothetical protein
MGRNDRDLCLFNALLESQFVVFECITGGFVYRKAWSIENKLYCL